MNKRGQSTWIAAVLVTFIAVAAPGCASKKYVNKQMNSVNQKLAQYEKQTNDRIAWINNKEQKDIAQVNERIAATDQKVSQVAGTIKEAQGTASRAMEEADMNKTANSTAIAQLESGVTNAFNYELLEKADVLFAFNKATLTASAKATLDELATKFEAAPRGVVELTGFTDRSGSASYNLTLSRQRAWAVQRYLVAHNVPVRSIHIVGMGEEGPPAGLEPEGTESSAGVARNERDAQARRVNIRVFSAGGTDSASRSQQ